MSAIAGASRSRFAHVPGGSALDDRTWRDLNLDEVFVAIDRTESTLGQQALYHRLRTDPVACDLDAFEALVSRMTRDVEARERAQLALARLQDPHGYDLWWLARGDAVESHGWYAIFPLLAVATVTVALLTALGYALLPILFGLIAIDVVARLLAADEIGTLGLAFRQVAPVIATGEALSFLDGEEIAPLVAAFRADVGSLRRLKMITRWLSGDPLMASFAPDGVALIVGNVARAIYEYLSILLLLDGNGVYFGGHDVRRHRASLLRLVAAIGEVDAAISVASWREERADWTRPQFLAPGSAAALTDLRHPLLTGAVPNTIGLAPGHGILVTGSNMSGKSTFVRTVGVNTVLAQTINTCLATRYEAPVFRVRSCIGREDDLVAGKSYYLVEVEAMLALVRASGDTHPHLFLCDELFRGTNTVERIGAAEAVLTELVAEDGQSKPHVVIAATHDGELVDLLRDAYASYHFADRLGPEGLVFEYRLQAGPAVTRNAIVLLRQYGASAALVDRALNRAAALDQQRSHAAN